MGKPTDKRGRGRPASDDSMSERVLVRMDKPTKAALEAWVKRDGIGADATAVRIALVEKLRAENLLK